MLAKSVITALILTVALSSAPSGSAARVQVGVPRDSEVERFPVASEPNQELREEFNQTYSLSPNGRVGLENLNGGVRITAWERNEVQIHAVKRAYRRERLDEARIDVTPSPNAIRIRTVYPDRSQTFTDDAKARYNNPAIVDYKISVPRNARLESIDLVNGSLDVDGVEGDIKASSVNGRVTARGLSGVSRLSTVNGTLEVAFSKLDESRPITLGSVNGGVVLIIPSDSNAVVKANTVHGGISNDFGLMVLHGDYVGHELHGQIGNGGTRIKLENVNGGIAIKRAQDGRPLSPSTCLLSEKKEKHKDKVWIYQDRQRETEERRQEAEERRQEAEERRRESAEQREADRENARREREAQAEIERGIRESQRELERAQREIQRETQRQVREQIRRNVRVEARGTSRTYSYRFSTTSESKSFPVSGSPRVNVITHDGSVTVHGWDKPEVSYTVTKHAHDDEQLRRVFVKSEQQGSAISIVASSDADGGAASFEVFVPRKTALHVSSNDGELNLDGVSGDLTLRTGDGSIKVSNSSGQLQVNTGDGEIRITNFDGQLDARTGDGPISLDGSFSGLAARTGEGSISLSVPANSDFTIETNAANIDTRGLTVAEDLAPSQRVRRWKVGRGGNVFVLSTGEGRITVHPRLK